MRVKHSFRAKALAQNRRVLGAIVWKGRRQASESFIGLRPVCFFGRDTCAPSQLIA